MTAEQCEECGREFQTVRGLKTHIGRMHDPLPNELAVQLYVREGLTTAEISERVGISRRGVSERLNMAERRARPGDTIVTERRDGSKMSAREVAGRKRASGGFLGMF